MYCIHRRESGGSFIIVADGCESWFEGGGIRRVCKVACEVEVWCEAPFSALMTLLPPLSSQPSPQPTFSS